MSALADPGGVIMCPIHDFPFDPEWGCPYCADEKAKREAEADVRDALRQFGCDKGDE